MSNVKIPNRDIAKAQFGERLTYALLISPLGSGKNRENLASVLSQEMIRRGHNVTYMAVRKWLAGESVPSIEKLADIADLANCSVDYLIHGKGPMRMTQESYALLELFDTMTPEQRKALLDLGNAFSQQKPDRETA